MTLKPIRSRGFTLSEIIVVAALFFILGGGVLTAFLTGQTSFFSADSYVQVQQEARRAFDNMVRELREAGPPPPGPPVVSLTANGPAGSNQLNFQIARGYNLAAPCLPDIICWGSENAAPGGVGEWIHYAVMTNATLAVNNQLQLVRCVSGAQGTVVDSTTPNCRVLANNIVTTSFGLLDNAGNATVASPRVVTVSLQARHTNPRLPGGSQGIGIGGGATPLTTRVRLRN